MGLTPDQVKALLAPDVERVKKKSLKERYPLKPQVGPLRFVDTELRCASRGCGTSTHMKVEGIPYCSMHTMRKLNEIIVEMTEIRRRELGRVPRHGTGDNPPSVDNHRSEDSREEAA